MFISTGRYIFLDIQYLFTDRMRMYGIPLIPGRGPQVQDNCEVLLSRTKLSACLTVEAWKCIQREKQQPIPRSRLLSIAGAAFISFGVHRLLTTYRPDLKPYWTTACALGHTVWTFATNKNPAKTEHPKAVELEIKVFANIRRCLKTESKTLDQQQRWYVKTKLEEYFTVKEVSQIIGDLAPNQSIQQL